MKIRPLVLFVPFLFWQCASPPTHPAQPPVSPQSDDDHRLVSREDFQASPWHQLSSAVSWKPAPNGASFLTQDGREVWATFVSDSLVRWWVPAAATERPTSPGCVYPAAVPKTIKVSESQEVVSITSATLELRVSLKDLSWTLVRGTQVALRSQGGPQVSGRRLNQVLLGSDSGRWWGPGLNAGTGSTKTWIGPTFDADGSGPTALPAVLAAGGSSVVALWLDNSYQSYVRAASGTVSLGSLNGGLDLLVACAARPQAALESLTQVTGRPAVVPVSAQGTALLSPATEEGAFLRQAKVSVETAQGPAAPRRLRFQTVLSSSAEQAPPVAPLMGVALGALPRRLDWNTPRDEFNQPFVLAQMQNLLPARTAQRTAQAWSGSNPGLRPWILAATQGPGSLRWAHLQLTVTGLDSDLSRVLALSAVGATTPGVRLDLSGLKTSSTRRAAFNALGSWLMAPELTLDWGEHPADTWESLSESDKKRIKTLLDRRSQFKPYFQQLERRSAATGWPAWVPIGLVWPDDPTARSNDDEFLVGEDLLVAPVLGDGTSRSVYFPGPGVWFDFWSGQEYGGGRAYDVDAALDHPLLFARGGAVVPQREFESFDDRDLYNPLTVHVFPGGRGSGVYWLDDGKSLLSTEGSAWETKLTFDYRQKDMTLTHELQSSARIKPDPYLLYKIHNVFKPRQVKINDKAIPLYGDSWGVTDTDRSAAWYENDHSLLIKTFRPERDQEVLINF